MMNRRRRRKGRASERRNIGDHPRFLQSANSSGMYLGHIVHILFKME